MTEGLARGENVDDLVLVEKLHRAAPDHVEVLGGRPVLDQDLLAGSIGALPQQPRRPARAAPAPAGRRAAPPAGNRRRMGPRVVLSLPLTSRRDGRGCGPAA